MAEKWAGDTMATKKEPAAPDAPKLLSGGNPQIAKGDGAAPVEAYLAAMPGWKQDVGRWLHAFVIAEVPDVQQAVRWNSPFYGVAGQGWFLSFHCFTKYVKVTFFDGTALDPMPPEASKDPTARYVHVTEARQVDEAQLRSWIRQASQRPGWAGF